MEFLNFLRAEPMMAWFVCLALLLTIVPVISVLWRRRSGRGQTEITKQTAQATKPVHFGNQAELIILLVGILLLLAVISWIYDAFFG